MENQEHRTGIPWSMTRYSGGVGVCRGVCTEGVSSGAEQHKGGAHDDLVQWSFPGKPNISIGPPKHSTFEVIYMTS